MLLYFCASDPEKSEKQRSREAEWAKEIQRKSATAAFLAPALVLKAGYSMSLVPLV